MKKTKTTSLSNFRRDRQKCEAKHEAKRRTTVFRLQGGKEAEEVKQEDKKSVTNAASKFVKFGVVVVVRDVGGVRIG